MTTQTTQIAFPVLDSQATQSFIDANVASNLQSGDLQSDFKKALIAHLGLSGSGYSLDDLWKRYQLGTTVTSDPEAVGPVKRSPPEHAGQHPKHFLPPGRLKNTGNTNGFPNAPQWDGTYATLQSRGYCSIYSRNVDSGPLWNADGSNYYYVYYNGTVGSIRIMDTAATIPYYPEWQTTESTTDIVASTALIRDMVWNSDGTAFITVVSGANDRFETYNLTGTPYSPGAGQDATADAVSSTFNAARDVPIALDISPDGENIFYVSDDSLTYSVVYGELTTPWDVSTWNELGTVDTAQPLSSLKFGYDGLNVYGLGKATDILYRYALSTPYDLSTMSTTATESWDINALVPAGQNQVIGLSMMPTASGIKGIQLLGYDLSFEDARMLQFIFQNNTNGTYSEPSAANVVLQLAFENAPESGVSQTWVDRSTYAQPIELRGSGSSTVATGGPFGGSYFQTGLSGEVQFTDDGSFVFGTGDWTVEANLYITGWASPDTIMGHDAQWGTQWIKGRGNINENYTVLGFTYRENSVIINNYRPSLFHHITLNTWHHVLVQRSGDTLSWYVDGIRVETRDCTGLDMAVSSLGDDFNLNTSGTLCRIANVRVTKGGALASGSGFTPPSAVFDDPV